MKKKAAPSGAATRKEQLRHRMYGYADRSGQQGMAHACVAMGWQDGYRAAGKGGIPSKLVKLLRPIR